MTQDQDRSYRWFLEQVEEKILNAPTADGVTPTIEKYSLWTWEGRGTQPKAWLEREKIDEMDWENFLRFATGSDMSSVVIDTTGGPFEVILWGDPADIQKEEEEESPTELLHQILAELKGLREDLSKVYKPPPSDVMIGHTPISFNLKPRSCDDQGW